ncbi:T9SS type A sorting domain-containing protein [Winogradskyella haliclonae]|uniref:T9SS C-terminal target domain-containing protein n=1 Tax=Winogradskyella haliclonae TaxID=2048558 RepID=A0ABQ2C047_9FLAO|nr:T9SS type A sorting domain-containing protein [Winogradskyella haliclonae]GGI58112.1 T9SS C-terminal target domain-containing protein [Winogradskyella haliclonae]
MKAFLPILILFCVAEVCLAQTNTRYRIISSNIGSSGSSQTISTSQGTYNVSQSIGQSSVIGTHRNSNYVLRQGYQQPLFNITIVEDVNYNLDVKVYPNPFNQQLTIDFISPIQNDIMVLLNDVSGKLIYSNRFSAAQKIDLQFSTIQSGAYFLKVISGSKHFNSKLIKSK